MHILHILHILHIWHILHILHILHSVQNGAEFWHRTFKEQPAACGLKGPLGSTALQRVAAGGLHVGPFAPCGCWQMFNLRFHMVVLKVTNFDRFESEVSLVCNETRHFGMVWADVPFFCLSLNGTGNFP